MGFEFLCRGWCSEAGIQRRFRMGWDGMGFILPSFFFSLWVDGRAYVVFRDLGGRRGVGWGVGGSRWDGGVDIIDEMR
jgi:hypothetical protein